MDNLSWGNPAAHRVRVHFISTSTVIYEGMPVCYNYDTTTNWAGGSASDGAVTASTTLTAGSPATAQAKYIEVESPVTANLQWFAGVVARGGWCGKTTSATAGVGQLLDIYVPNGAIVPVRSNISSTESLNALAIQNGQNYFGDPAASTTNGAARYVAVAEETVDRGTAGLCLARLCPNEFIYQSAGSSKLEFVETATIDIAANFINVHSSQASGGFTALFVRSEVDTAASDSTGCAIYSEANLLGVAAADFDANRFALNLWGGEQGARAFSAVHAEIFELGANLESITLICPLQCTTFVDGTNPPPANTHYMMYFIARGTDKPDGLFKAHDVSCIGAAAQANTSTQTWGIDDITIPIRVGATTYYLYASVAAGAA